MEAQVGQHASVTLTVGHGDTALAVRSGDVAVLATPRVLALAEQAAVAALGGGLPEGSTSVGTWAEVAHLAPTPVGGTVVADARLVATEGRTLTFEIAVTEGERVVARVAHRRAVVDRARFGGG